MGVIIFSHATLNQSLNHLAGWEAWWPSPSVAHTHTHTHTHTSHLLKQSYTCLTLTETYICMCILCSCICTLISPGFFIFSCSRGWIIPHLSSYGGLNRHGNPSGYVCVPTCESVSVCEHYLAELLASLSEQMVLQQVIMTQDKLLNWLCLCESRDTKYHCHREGNRGTASPSAETKCIDTEEQNENSQNSSSQTHSLRLQYCYAYWNYSINCNGADFLRWLGITSWCHRQGHFLVKDR